MSSRETEHLRVLIANERRDRLALVAPIVAALGHEVDRPRGRGQRRRRGDRQRAARRGSRGARRELRPRALMLIEKIVQEAACPVIVLLHAAEPGLRHARRRGEASSPTSPMVSARARHRLAELHRHRSAPLRGVPRPRGSLRPPGHDRAGQGHPDGATLRGRRRGVRHAARPIARGEPKARRHRLRRRGRAPASAQASARTGQLALAPTGSGQSCTGLAAPLRCCFPCVVGEPGQSVYDGPHGTRWVTCPGTSSPTSADEPPDAPPGRPDPTPQTPSGRADTSPADKAGTSPALDDSASTVCRSDTGNPFPARAGTS